MSILGASSLDGLGVYMDASNENAARVHRGLSVAELWDSKMCNAYAIHMQYITIHKLYINCSLAWSCSLAMHVKKQKYGMPRLSSGH